MRPERLRLFSNLVTQLLEDSTAGDLVRKYPGGDAIMKKLHKDMKLPHDVTWNELGTGERFHWTPFSETKYGSFVLVRGPRGVGAIKASPGGSDYTAITSTGTNIRSKTDKRGGNIVDFLEGEIGKPLIRYSGSTQGPKISGNRTDNPRKMTYPEKGQYRRDLTKPSEKTMSIDKLLTKFKPLWLSGLTKAIADVSGFVQAQIKNGAYEKAEGKIKRLKLLQTIHSSVEAGEELPSSGRSYGDPHFLSTAIKSAVNLAAHQYYPEAAGEIRKSGYAYETNSAAVNQLLSDIASGDTSKMFTVAHYFRRSLVS